MVRCFRPEASGRFMVISLSLTHFGILANLLTRAVLTAKPTPVSKSTPKEFAEFAFAWKLSFTQGCDVNIISAATRAVQWGLSTSSLSRRVRTFHAPRLIGTVVIFFFAARVVLV